MNIEDHKNFRHMIDESLAGAISAEREESLRDHLETCAPCQEYLSASNRVIAGLGSFSFGVDPTLNARVFATLRLRAQRGHAAQSSRRRWVLISLAAVVLTMGGVVRRSAIRGPDRFCLRYTARAGAARATCFLDCALALCLHAVPAIAFVIESRHSPGRKDSMKLLRRFLNIVPKTVQLWASILVGCALLVGLVVAYETADQGAVLRTMSAYGGAALVLGILLAIWLLCLGFVFADARRRDMRSVLWVLVAALFPHLLGFLLYFVIRHPIASTCTHCGGTVSNHQRFCSWCGTAQFPPSSTKGPLTANVSQGASQ